MEQNVDPWIINIYIYFKPGGEMEFEVGLLCMLSVDCGVAAAWEEP